MLCCCFSSLDHILSGSEFLESESESFLKFIRSVDPHNRLRNHPHEFPGNTCLHKSVQCNLQGTSIEEIRLKNLDLSDANSLCKLHNLQVLCLARNLIRGTIPNSIWHWSKLRYLNLSSNDLSGRIPFALIKLENLQSLDISNNHFKHLYRHSLEPIALQRLTLESKGHTDSEFKSSAAAAPSKDNSGGNSNWLTSTILVFGIGLFCVFIYVMSLKAVKLTRLREILKISQDSPQKMPRTKDVEEVKAEESQSELVFLVENDQRFRLEDLLEAAADLLSQSICSCLYKVILRDNAAFAVKKLKKLQVSIEELGRTMRKIGNIKHPNILHLVVYKSTDEEKLLIYQYQSNGSLLNLLESYIGGKRDFPWKLRLSMASGIAGGLAFMHQRLDGEESIPHGNIKLSNVLLDDNMEPLISEYGISRFLDPKKNPPFASHCYTAPEKSLTEKGDVYSVGIILLELLTGKNVEKTGIDLPKWVRSMVREEWTVEVFDKEVTIDREAIKWAAPLLDISLKCVSHSPQH